MRGVGVEGFVKCGLLACLVVVAGCRDAIPVKRLPRRPEEGQIAPVQGRRVLVVHSYHADYPWVEEINRGLADAFDGHDVAVEYFYMDTKRQPNDAWKRQAGRWAMVAVDRFQPDVIVTADDNAQEYFARQLVGTDRPVVFCGVNQDPAKYGYPARNVTGVTERPDWGLAMEWVEQDFPGARIGVLSSDDPTSHGAFSYMKQVQVPQTHVVWRLEGTWAGWQRAITELSEQVDVLVFYMYHTLRKTNKPDARRIDPVQVMEWTVNHTELPTVGFLDFAIKDGVLMGIVESGYEHGLKSGDYACRILNGAQPARLPIIRAHQGTCVYNQKTVEHLQLPLVDEWVRRGVREIGTL